MRMRKRKRKRKRQTLTIVNDLIDKDIIDLESPDDNIGAEFISPCLKECTFTRRETGWFRSTAIRAWAGSLESIIKNDEIKIEILCSPEVDQSTYRALKEAISNEDKFKLFEGDHTYVLAPLAISVVESP